MCAYIPNKTLICCPSDIQTTTTQKSTNADYEENNERNCAYPPIAIKVRRDEWPHKAWNSKLINDIQLIIYYVCMCDNAASLHD